MLDELSILILQCKELQKLNIEEMTLPIIETLSQFSFKPYQLDEIQSIIANGFNGMNPFSWPDLIQNIMRGELLTNTNDVLRFIYNINVIRFVL